MTIFFGITFAAVAILLGPIWSPEPFNWLHHTTSEQAAQNMPGAWIMRLGFLAYGLATAIEAIRRWRLRPWVRWPLVVFGLGLIATAFWSSASILPGVATDVTEDWVHSITSAIVGAGFVASCCARLFAPDGRIEDSLAWIGLASAVLLPIMIEMFPGVAGLFERLTFLVSFVYIWDEFRKDEEPAKV